MNSGYSRLPSAVAHLCACRPLAPSKVAFSLHFPLVHGRVELGSVQNALKYFSPEQSPSIELPVYVASSDSFRSVSDTVKYRYIVLGRLGFAPAACVWPEATVEAKAGAYAVDG